MRVFDLMAKDLKQQLQDWRTALFLVLMPVGFTLLFGFMFGGFEGQENDPRLPVGYLDQDQGALSPFLVDLLEDSSVIRLVVDKEARESDLRQSVTDGDLAAAIFVPEGYGESVLSGSPLEMVVAADERGTAGTTVRTEVTTAVNRLANAVLSARLSVEVYLAVQQFSGPAAQEAYFNQALADAVAAWGAPPITVKTTRSGPAAGDPEDQNAFIQSSPAMMMQFAIAGLIGAAEIVVTERKTRALQRMLTTAISRAQILVGHFLAMAAMIFMQIVLLVIFGQLFLRLDYTQAPLATLVIAVAAALAFGGLGLLIGSLARTSEAVVVLALVPMFIFSGLGGAWVPLEFTSETVQAIGRFSPVSWGILGFKNILARGMGLEGVWLPALALTGFAAVFFALAVWRFEFE